MEGSPLLIVLGPTASGKTKLAVTLADRLKGEVISADSRQVFKGMDVGTGKDLQEYAIGDRLIPYHLIDIKNAGDHYNVNEFKEDFYNAFKDISGRAKLPILCGGTGMYIHSLLQNQEYTAVPVNNALREDLADKDTATLRLILTEFPVAFTRHADQSSHKRIIRAIEIATYLSDQELPLVAKPSFEPFVIGLDPGRELRRKNVAERLAQRLANGLIDEVETLLNSGVSDEMLTFYGLEYKFVSAHLRGELKLDELQELLTIAICQFAKRQMTFFRKMEKDGVKIHWYNPDEDFNQLVNSVLEDARRIL